MPSIKRKICSKHGIYETKSCELCKQDNTKQYDEQSRSKDSYKIYHSTRWKKLRNRQLSKEPLCVNFAVCGNHASIADHIVEIKDSGEPFSINNLQSMCQSCHNSKSAQERANRAH